MRRESKPNLIVTLIFLFILLVLLNGLWSCATAVKPEVPRPTPGGIRFTLSAPGAKQVALVGSFNSWVKTATPMQIQTGEVWSVVVPLTEGEYTFMYLIDGAQWITPPQAEDFVTDGFGQTNGVVVVR